MTEGRRSRLGWKTTPAPRPESPRRFTPIVIAYVCIVLLAISIGVLTAYIAVLKSSRDTEQQRIEQTVIHNNCALMDALPAGGPLTPLRARYHCGPGLPTTTP